MIIIYSLWIVFAFFTARWFLKKTLKQDREKDASIISFISWAMLITGKRTILNDQVTSGSFGEALTVGLILASASLLISLIVVYIVGRIKQSKDVKMDDTKLNITVDNNNFAEPNSNKPKNIDFKVIVTILLTISLFLTYKISNLKSNTEISAISVDGSQIAESIPRSLPPTSPQTQRITIPDVGSIDIPDSMEITNEAWNQNAVEYLYNSTGMNLPPNYKQNVVVKQKGLDNYARIMFTSVISKPGDYAKLNDHFTATSEELNEISNTAKPQTMEDLAKVGNRLLDWYPPRVEEVNGMTAVVMSYRRQLNNNPPVLVWEYRFQNNDRLNILTLSFRQDESDLWTRVFEKSLVSFRITDIK